MRTEKTGKSDPSSGNSHGAPSSTDEGADDDLVSEIHHLGFLGNGRLDREFEAAVLTQLALDHDLPDLHAALEAGLRPALLPGVLLDPTPDLVLDRLDRPLGPRVEDLLTGLLVGDPD